MLLLDEPLSALDANLRRQMQVELKSLQREVGIAFIFVTHDQEEAMVMSDRIALLRSGELEQVATPREIYGRPATAYAAQFIGHTNLLRGEVQDGSYAMRIVVVAGFPAGWPGALLAPPGTDSARREPRPQPKRSRQRTSAAPGLSRCHGVDARRLRGRTHVLLVEHRQRALARRTNRTRILARPMPSLCANRRERT